MLTALEPRKLLPKLSETLLPVFIFVFLFLFLFVSDIPMGFPAFERLAAGAGRMGLRLEEDEGEDQESALPSTRPLDPLPPVTTRVVPPPPTNPVELKMEESPLMETPPTLPRKALLPPPPPFMPPEPFVPVMPTMPTLLSYVPLLPRMEREAPEGDPELEEGSARLGALYRKTALSAAETRRPPGAAAAARWFSF